MGLKASLSDKSGIFQVWILLLIVLGGIIISSITTVILSLFIPGISMENPGYVRFIQTISVLFTFLIPTLVLAWLCSDSPSDYLSLRRRPSAKVFLLVLFGLLLLSPTINITSVLNKQLVLPPFLESLELWMQQKEKEMEDLVNLLINEAGIIALISNLFVIAFLAALTEEFFFRGAIQRIIEKWTNNHHVVIWSAAILFSAIHIQFYGFIPRMILGAYFGYLLYWSKSIWVPVFAHFLNNAVAVFASRSADLNEHEFISGDIKSEHLIGYSILAAVTLTLFYYLNKKLKAEARQVL
ncbi:CPBP family intramembrane glutamic endopeptidase [Massilibacteroides sp.]|uniref:CPBP family intramembrane glutamic endopeptidase n=1 Tax=Massilibacteroides sp. TaxID=2034766 RepID=UPI0026103DB2|nr:CPBP family intramembrane glutamic endopeptidase [Massilibacteroides sp.]MDD4514903.1 CPBP family intramembrane metalloprotease [Massilibacteroides sp.]